MSVQDKINIVVATDNHYAILLGALIKSIEENHKTGELIDLFIIDDGISQSSKQKLVKSCNPAVTTLHWFKTKDTIPSNVKIPVDKSAFPITTYLRLFAPYIIPKDAKRVIYLDVDMILETDISKLWNLNLEGNLFAAAPDLGKTFGNEWGGVPNYKELGFPADTNYFNAGMMLIDPVKWREEDISNKVIKTINDNMAHLNYPDQYGLNVTLANRWLVLDQRWNCFSALDIKDPYLIHYLDIKPIFKSYRSNQEYKALFYKYLRLTPWKNHKPISDYKRLVRKAFIKAGKQVKLLFKSK